MASGYESVLKTIKGSHDVITPGIEGDVRDRRDGLVAISQHYQQIRGLGPKVAEAPKIS